MQNKIEESFISKFIIKEKRVRYLTFISKEKTRRKFTEKLYHFKHFDWKLFREIPGSENERSAILAKISENKNIKTCQIISANSDIDSKTVTFENAISDIVGEEGTVLIFGNADVVYYEAEAFDRRFISI